MPNDRRDKTGVSSLSALLFLFVVEILAIKIKNNQNLKYFKSKLQRKLSDV